MDFKDRYRKENNVAGIQEMSPQSENVAATEAKRTLPMSGNMAAAGAKGTPPMGGNVAAAEAKAKPPMGANVATAEAKATFPMSGNMAAAEAKATPPMGGNVAAAEAKATPPMGANVAAAEAKGTFPMSGNMAAAERKGTLPIGGNMAAATEENVMGYRNNCRRDTSYYGGTQGFLPPCGDLASPYVPMLEPLPERYSHTDALNNGTLFPALNLPFHLKVNAENVVTTPLNELQALEFVITELGLYLDTHPDDEEAFYVYKQYVELEKKVRDAYATNKAPLFQPDSAKHDTFAWIRDPWPWQQKD